VCNPDAIIILRLGCCGSLKNWDAVVLSKIGMLWLSQNYYDNYVRVIVRQLSVTNWDAVAFPKLL
jgi:hypothetical protein